MKHFITFGTDNLKDLKQAVHAAGMLIKDTDPISYRYSDAKPFKVVSVGCDNLKLAKSISSLIAPYQLQAAKK